MPQSPAKHTPTTPENSGNTETQHTPSGPSPPPPKENLSTVRKLAQKYERPPLSPQDTRAEPARPKHDLKEEYKDPWTRRPGRRAGEGEQRVRRGEGALDPGRRELWEREREKESEVARESVKERESGKEGESEKEREGEGVREGSVSVAEPEFEVQRGGEGDKVEGEGSDEEVDEEVDEDEEEDDADDDGEGDARQDRQSLTPSPSQVYPLSHDNLQMLQIQLLQSRASLHQTDTEHSPHPNLNTPCSSLRGPSSPYSQRSSPSGSEVSARTDEVFPVIRFESIALYLKGRDEIEVRTKILHVRTLLLRCAVLVRTARSMEQAEWNASVRRRRQRSSKGTAGEEDEEDDRNDAAARMGKSWYKAYSKAGRTAEKAEHMARGLGIDGLQARTWYWRGRADGGRRYWDEAATAFWRAEQLDKETVGTGSVEDYGKIGLTPFERRDVRLLKEECKRRDELAQRQRQEREWRNGEQLEGLWEESEEESPLGAEPLRSEGYSQAGEEESVHDMEMDVVAKEQGELLREAISAAREKQKMQYFAPFSEKEQKYIMYG